MIDERMRAVGSRRSILLAGAAACAALYGPLHAGERAVLQLLTDRKSQQLQDSFKRVKSGKAGAEGFGHRVYKTTPPREDHKTVGSGFEVRAATSC